MISITDLQIGDIVICKSAEDSNVCKLRSIELYQGEYFCLLYSLDMKKNFTGKEDTMFPLPLSYAFFEQNKWQQNNGYLVKEIDNNSYLEYYKFEHRLRKYWKGVDEWQNHANVKDIVFTCNSITNVHQLQHALRICGLSDIADNVNYKASII